MAATCAPIFWTGGSAVEHATHQARGFNPLCGDQLVLTLDVDHDQVREARFAGIVPFDVTSVAVYVFCASIVAAGAAA